MGLSSRWSLENGNPSTPFSGQDHPLRTHTEPVSTEGGIIPLWCLIPYSVMNILTSTDGFLLSSESDPVLSQMTEAGVGMSLGTASVRYAGTLRRRGVLAMVEVP